MQPYGKGSSKVRALSDLEGKFVLKSETPNPILIISCIGFDAIEKRIENRSNQLFVLKESPYELEAVFVTALGINRSGTALNYNVKQMDGDELNKVKTTNIANALAGRMAGISVNESAAGMGGRSTCGNAWSEVFGTEQSTALCGRWVSLLTTVVMMM